MERTHLELKHILSRIEATLAAGKEAFLPILRSPLFLIPLSIKIIASFFFASGAAVDSFIPFLKYFALANVADIYSHAATLNPEMLFPYPNPVPWIFSIAYASGSFFFGTALAAVTHLDLFLLRIPVLLADTGILLILVAWFKNKEKALLALYWCSPITFYISYVHGQLDAVPVFFLFCFLYLFFRERDWAALFFLGLSIASKTGMILVLPFTFLYFLRERGFSIKTLLKILLPPAIFLMLNAANLLNPHFIDSALINQQQLRIFDLRIMFNEKTVLYVLPIVYTMLLFKFATFKRYSRDLFMTFLGFSFFTITLFIPPIPGLYFWIIPFAVYFFAKAEGRQRTLYHLLSFAYFLFFIMTQDSDLIESFRPFAESDIENVYAFMEANWSSPAIISNLSFTFLQGVLLANIYWISKKGIEQYTRYKMHYKPFLIGVAGDSGSGKSTFADLMVDIFAQKHVSVIAGDDMHKWERGDEKWTRYTHLDPQANELHSEINCLYKLRDGSSIIRRNYDHASGKFALPKVHDSKRLVIFEGLHSLFLEKAREIFDLKVFISPEEQLKLHWKIMRDQAKRGYTKEAVLEQVKSRQGDVEKYINVQEKHSDISISLKNTFDLGDRIGNQDVELCLYLEIGCTNNVNLAPLLEELSAHLDTDFKVNDERQTMKFSGNIDRESLDRISRIAVPELDEIGISQRKWSDGYNGIIQLFTVFYIFESMKLQRYE